MKQQEQQTKWSQFIPLISVFFFWGFVAASNDILIPVFKNSFTLSQLESQLVNNAFYAAYFVGSLVFLSFLCGAMSSKNLDTKKLLLLGFLSQLWAHFCLCRQLL